MKFEEFRRKIEVENDPMNARLNVTVLYWGWDDEHNGPISVEHLSTRVSLDRLYWFIDLCYANLRDFDLVGFILLSESQQGRRDRHPVPFTLIRTYNGYRYLVCPLIENVATYRVLAIQDKVYKAFSNRVLSFEDYASGEKVYVSIGQVAKKVEWENFRSVVEQYCDMMRNAQYEFSDVRYRDLCIKIRELPPFKSTIVGYKG